jgi:hypothetical protein
MVDGVRLDHFERREHLSPPALTDLQREPGRSSDATTFDFLTSACWLMLRPACGERPSDSSPASTLD